MRDNRSTNAISHRTLGGLRAIALFFVFATLAATANAALADSNVAAERQRTLMRHLWPVVKASGKGARIYYNAECAKGGLDDVAMLPSLALDLAGKSDETLAAVQGVFRKVKDVVIKDEPELIRIRIGDVPDAVLQTNFDMIAFDPFDRYTDQAAVLALVMNHEFEAEWRRLGLRVPAKLFSILSPPPTEELPHVPAQLSNITMDGALDVVAKTFKSVVLYGICEDKNVFDITVTGGIYFDDSSLERSDGERR